MNIELWTEKYIRHSKASSRNSFRSFPYKLAQFSRNQLSRLRDKFRVMMASRKSANTAHEAESGIMDNIADTEQIFDDFPL